MNKIINKRIIYYYKSPVGDLNPRPSDIIRKNKSLMLYRLS